MSHMIRRKVRFKVVQYKTMRNQFLCRTRLPHVTKNEDMNLFKKRTNIFLLKLVVLLM